MTKWVYTFGDGAADGRADMKNLLGGKGANLAEMASLGLPVPPGLTITTEVCTYYYDNGHSYPAELEGDVDARVESVLEVLRTTPGIAEARPLSDEEQAALIAPWLGGEGKLEDLPAPRLIDVRLQGAGPDAKALQGRLDLTVTGAVYDDHATWRGPLAAAANALERVALAATVLVLLTSIAMVAFAARATLIANGETIKTVRLIGGEDEFLVRAFVPALAFRAAIGGLAGALLACLILLLLPGAGAEVGLGDVLSPGWSGWLAMAVGVPLLGAVVAWLTSRWAVRAVLRQMP